MTRSIHILLLLTLFGSLTAFDFNVFGGGSGGDLSITGEEQAAFDAYKDFKNIKARDIVKSIFKKNPKSPVAFFVLGLITREGEGNSSEALYYIKKAIGYFEDACGTTPSTTKCVYWHSIASQERINILISLDRIDEAYNQVLHYNQIYNPDLEDHLTWIYIKQREFEKAEEIARKLARQSDPFFKVNGMNNLCVIASERNFRQKAAEICEDGANQSDSEVLSYNTCIAKFSVIDYAGVERIGRSGLKETDDLSGSIWEMIVNLYAIQGRYSEALSAAKEAANAFRTLSAQDQESNRAHYFKTVSNLLFLLGLNDDAFSLAEEGFNTPDRTGNVSGDREFHKLITLVYHDAALRIYSTHLLNQEALQPFKKCLESKIKRWQLEFSRLMLHWQINNQIEKENLLVKLITPYAPSQGPVEALPFWMHLVLLDSTGTALFSGAIDKAELRETEIKDKLKPFYDTLRLMTEFYSHNTSIVIENGTKLLQILPPQEVVLKDLIRTMLAFAYRDEGDTKNMRTKLTEIIKTTPTFINFLQETLPVKITSESGPFTNEIVDLLDDHPRLDNTDDGLLLKVKSGPNWAMICLFDQFNTSLHCSTLNDVTEKNKENLAIDMVVKFLDEALSPKVDLSQMDVSTLNGAPVKSTSKDALKSLLNSKDSQQKQHNQPGQNDFSF